MSARTTAAGDSATGGCLCGAVRYRASGPAGDPTLCHCRTCRKAAGSPVVAWVTFPSAGFSWTAAEPVSYRSSAEVIRTFCGACGTPLTYQHAKLPHEIDITTCSLDEPEAHPPRDQVWTSHRLGWMAGAGGLPSFAHRRGSP